MMEKRLGWLTCGLILVAYHLLTAHPFLNAQQPKRAGEPEHVDLSRDDESGRGKAERPNILMIFTDDQGWNDVGCYGSEIPTPNIDSLAREGIKLNQFYAASSICTPSRFGLLTGRFPTRSHDQLLNALMFLTAEDLDRGIRPDETTYVQQLKESGYATALIGKWHLGHGDKKFWPTEYGFDSFFGHTGGCVDFFTLHYGTKPDWYRDDKLIYAEVPNVETYATDVITEEALQFLQGHASDNRPFYLHVAFNAPHFGKEGDFDTGKTTNTMQPKPADLERVPKSVLDPLRRSFAAKVIGMDDAIGRLLQKLDDLRLRENTLVIFMTDHGGDPEYGGDNRPLRGGKATLFEGGLRVPCLVRWPGKIPKAIESDAVTCAIDIFPTLCSVAGISDRSSATVDGQNLWPILLGQSAGKSRTLIWQTADHAELERKSWLALRAGDWKLVDTPTDAPMLFDLSSDPNEQHDLSETQPDQVRELVEVADKMIAEHQRFALE